MEERKQKNSSEITEFIILLGKEKEREERMRTYKYSTHIFQNSNSKNYQGFMVKSNTVLSSHSFQSFREDLAA